VKGHTHTHIHTRHT